MMFAGPPTAPWYTAAGNVDPSRIFLSEVIDVTDNNNIMTLTAHIQRLYNDGNPNNYIIDPYEKQTLGVGIKTFVNNNVYFQGSE
jgi:hypothetical protein